ncbi:MAG: hypothetical protein ACR2KT_05730 [Methylocella sp.]
MSVWTRLYNFGSAVIKRPMTWLLGIVATAAGVYVTNTLTPLETFLSEQAAKYYCGHLAKYPFRAASKSDSKNLFEFDQWERCDGAIGFL